jgi:hypothetical protein
MMYVLEYLIYHLKPYGRGVVQQCDSQQSRTHSHADALSSENSSSSTSASSTLTLKNKSEQLSPTEAAAQTKNADESNKHTSQTSSKEEKKATDVKTGTKNISENLVDVEEMEKSKE